ncbi:MAG: carbohydrate ABC transporter permease [Ruminiclostridium sp.]
MKKDFTKPKSWMLYSYLAPSVLLFVSFSIVPLAMAVYYSFFNWSGGPTKKFIALDNYLMLIKDDTFWKSCLNNIFIASSCVVFQLGIAFIISALLCSKLLKFKEFHRAIIFFPVVLSAVVVGFLFRMIYSSDNGLLNFLLSNLGLSSFIQPWLDNPKIALIYVTIPIVWQWIGMYVVIYMTSIKSIPEEIYESCAIDGASGFRQAIYITFPMIMDTIKVSVVLAISGSMKIFEHIYVMTGGGPGTSTMVMAQYSYKSSFIMNKMGYGSTIAVGILFVSLSFILVSQLLFERGKRRYE